MEDTITRLDRSQEKPPPEEFIRQTFTVATETMKSIESHKATQKLKGKVGNLRATKSLN